MELTGIALHHFGGLGNDRLAKTSRLTLEQINEAHRQRWPDFISDLGFYVGYNAIIWPDGRYTQTRLLGEETAAQKGHNFDTVSLCLAGNHLVEPPTFHQKTALKQLIIGLMAGVSSLKMAANTTLNIKRVYPHRYYQPGTECNIMPLYWGRELIGQPAGLVLTLKELLSKLRFGGKLTCAETDVRG